ncbi:MAG TPA: host attachment protein [Burkholderiales bacterium]|jgi:protein required for attachment to host cells
MGKRWVLVAHRSGARLFENRGPGKGLELLKTVEHPAGKLRSHDIDSDKHGRSFDRRGGGRHAYTTEQDPTMHIAEQFAKQLAELLDDGRTQQRYAQLVLVAEPRFLGILRAALTSTTAARVVATLTKDLGSTNARELPKHLEDVIAI